jgi:hypothetical protein
MNEEMFLDRIPCGLLKLKAQEPFSILYCNQTIKTWFCPHAFLEDLVCEADYEAIVYEIKDRLKSTINRFALEFKAKNEESSIWLSIDANYVLEEDFYTVLSQILQI